MKTLAWLLLAATIAGFGGRLWWMLGLFAPFRLQLLFLAAAVSAGLLVGVRRSPQSAGPTLAAALLGVLINTILVAPRWMPVEQPAAHGPVLTVMAFNLFVANHKLDDVSTASEAGRVIEESGASIVIIQEITVHRLGILGQALPGYRIAVGTGRPDSFGIALLIKRSADRRGDVSGLKIESVEEVDMTGGMTDVRQVAIRCQWQGRSLSLLGMHTISAVHARGDHFRSAMLAGAGAWARREREEGRAVIISGDFNATPWCSPFVDLLADASLVDSSRGQGAQGSWPSQLPGLLRIPIDHCLHSDDLVTRRREIGTSGAGSDHLPLTVELQWRDRD